MTLRAAFYIDGFNLYHAINDLDEPFLKWCNLRALAQLVIPSTSQRLVRVVFCTAYYPGDSEKRWRHDQFLTALRIVGVEIVLGHYVHEKQGCRHCGSQWDKPTEKQTDINLALSLFNDAKDDVFDIAYLLTADSDQAATGSFLARFCPDKKLVTVAPPGREPSVHIAKHASGGKIRLTRSHIERCLFPAVVYDAGSAKKHGQRPRQYTPPLGWTPPLPTPK